MKFKEWKGGEILQNPKSLLYCGEYSEKMRIVIEVSQSLSVIKSELLSRFSLAGLKRRLPQIKVSEETNSSSDNKWKKLAGESCWWHSSKPLLEEQTRVHGFESYSKTEVFLELLLVKMSKVLTLEDNYQVSALMIRSQTRKYASLTITRPSTKGSGEPNHYEPFWAGSEHLLNSYTNIASLTRWSFI